jgi:hypothetical protein
MLLAFFKNTMHVCVIVRLSDVRMQRKIGSICTLEESENVFSGSVDVVSSCVSREGIAQVVAL